MDSWEIPSSSGNSSVNKRRLSCCFLLQHYSHGAALEAPGDQATAWQISLQLGLWKPWSGF